MSTVKSSSKIEVRAETTNGKVDSQDLKEKIAELATALTTEKDSTRTIGQLCDDIIELVGIQYGGHTFQTIANHSNIQCDERHLRRCWKYYRLVSNKDCQSPELDKLIETKPRGVQELARIMDSDLSDEEKAGLVKALAVETLTKELTVSDIAIRVTNELARRGKLRRKPPAKKKNHAPGPNPQPTGIPMVVDSEALEQYAKCIRSYGKSGKIASIKDQFAVKALVVAVIDIIKQQVAQVGADGEYAYFLSLQIKQLEEIRLFLLKTEPFDETEQPELKEKVA